MDTLSELANLIQQRSLIDREIAAILNRPVHSGHFGEYIASAVFGIELNADANTKSHDGYFQTGPLAGHTVNLKYRTVHRKMLNLGSSIDPADHPDFYLALTGPNAPAGPARGTVAPLCVNAAYLFDSHELLAALAERGMLPGAPIGLRQAVWDAAMVFPEPRNVRLELTQTQRDALTLFAVVDR